MALGFLIPSLREEYLRFVLLLKNHSQLCYYVIGHIICSVVLNNFSDYYNCLMCLVARHHLEPMVSR